MSEPRRPDVMMSVFLKPSLRASGPISSCDPGPSRPRGNGWNSLIGNGLSSSSTCMAALSGAGGWSEPTLRPFAAGDAGNHEEGQYRTLRSGRSRSPSGQVRDREAAVRAGEVARHRAHGVDRHRTVGVREAHELRITVLAGFPAHLGADPL